MFELMLLFEELARNRASPIGHCSFLPSAFPPDLVAVETQLTRFLGADHRAAEAYVSVLGDLGLAPAFESAEQHGIWV